MYLERLSYATHVEDMAADICVNVAKYSHAIGVQPDNTIPWTHVAASNVYLVLKGGNTHTQNDQLILQVIQGNSVLVRIRRTLN